MIENTINSDSGAQIRDGIKCVNQQGVCPETEWPYSIYEFAQKPHATCYASALQHKLLSYQRLTQDTDHMRACLADGYPFVFGFTVYDSFESPAVAKTGVLNMPAPKEKVVGGHAIMAVGYNDAAKRFIIRNSWGADWGQAGYFTMPYDYVANNNLSDDFWTIRIVEQDAKLPKKKKK